MTRGTGHRFALLGVGTHPSDVNDELAVAANPGEVAVVFQLIYSYWCLLFVLIRQGLRGVSVPQRLIRALGEETGNPIMAFHRPSFFPSFERVPRHTTTENPLLGGGPPP